MPCFSAGEGAAATAEAPGIAVSTLSSVRSSATGQSSSNSNAAGEMSAAERAAAAGAVSGGGSGASVGGAAFGGVSLLQQDASAEVTVQNTAAGEQDIPFAALMIFFGCFDMSEQSSARKKIR